MTKAEFADKCMIIAEELNPNWKQDIFQCDIFVPKIIWNSATAVHGLALSIAGGKFFEQALQLTPYYIKTRLLHSKELIDLNKVMPWPYTVTRVEQEFAVMVGIYSSEVAVWAALYDNDLEELLTAYARK